MQKGHCAHHRLNHSLQSFDLVDRAQRSEHTECSDTRKRGPASAKHPDKSCDDTDKIELIPVTAQVSTLIDYEAETENPQHHLHGVKHLESNFYLFFSVGFFFVGVGHGKSDAVETNNQDYKGFKVSGLDNQSR